MMVKRILLKGVGASALAAVVAGVAWASGHEKASITEFAPLATPEGITLQLVGKSQGYGLDQATGSFLARNEIAYTNAEGMTLYTNDMDPPGKPVCVGDCAGIWPPAIAPANAEPLGDWSVIKRYDGRLQWALKSKPLYTYVKDVDIGSVAGNSPMPLGRGPNVGPRGSLKGPTPEELPLPEGWSPALMYPVTDVVLPAGLTIKEVPDALGVVLATQDGPTLYAFEGDPNQDQRTCASGSCNGLWSPVAAPQLAGPMGEFAFVVRDDGIRQWTYKGRGLYTYKKDFTSGGYANGLGINENWVPAYVMRYFMPPNVTVQETLRLGKVLATADGQTLYRREGFIFQSGGGHGTRHGIPRRPAVGRDIGTNARCRVDCDEWHPFTAPADAKPHGFWDVATRDDGSKQWIYQGYALWAYEGDKEPGQMTAHDTFDIAFSEDPNIALDVGTPYDAPTALYWTVAYP